MARCGCSDDCSCILASTDTVIVAGKGTADNPYQMSALNSGGPDGAVMSVNHVFPDTDGDVEVSTLPSLVGVPNPNVLTANGDGATASWQPPTDLTAAAAAAVAAALAASPPGDYEVDAGFLYLTGDSTKPMAQCPSSPNYGGDFDLRLDGWVFGNLNNGANQTIFGIQSTTLGNMVVRENANGKIALLVYPAPGSGSPVTATASVNTPVTNGLRVTWRQSDGRTRAWVPSTQAFKGTHGVTSTTLPNKRTFTDSTANFVTTGGPFGTGHVGMLLTCSQYPDGTTITAVNSPTSVHTSADALAAATNVVYTVGAVLTDGTTWARIGVDQFASLSGAARFASTSLPMTVGAAANGTALAAAGSRVGRVRYYSGIENPDGTGTITLLADPTFSGHALSTGSVTDTESNVFSLYGSAYIVPISGTVTKNGVTLGIASSATIPAITKRYYPALYGDLGTSDDTRRLAVKAAMNAAFQKGGGIVDVSTGGPPLVVNADPTILNRLTGLPYCAIQLLDNCFLEGDGQYSGGLQLANNANCHLIGGPGRLQNGTGLQDNIKNAGIHGLRLDGNKAGQDGTHDHDGMRFAQFPGLSVEDVMVMNCDGHGYYSSANGDFATSISDLGQNSNATVVKPLWLERVWAHDNARWGFFMSATNRKTHENELYAANNGTAQARIVGKVCNPAISSAGSFYLRFDSSATVYTITFAGGENAATIVSMINTAIGAAGTAALSAGASSVQRLMITSATTGGFSWVECYSLGPSNIPTPSVLLDLGLARVADSGPLPSTPMHLNGENNAAVGANEYGGFFADHSEARTDGWFAEGNLGDGVYVHNVNMCSYGHIESVSNNGLGVYIIQLDTSKMREILAGMNCVDLGYASYRTRTINDTSGSPITLPKAEVLFRAGTGGGYGITRWSHIDTVIAPGIKSSLGAGADNRHADAAVVIEHGVDPSLVFTQLIYGDGGLNSDSSPLGGNLRDYR